MIPKPFRILHLVNHVQNVGNGIVNVAVDLAIEQRRLGYEVSVASAGGNFVALLEAHGVRHLMLAQTGKHSAKALAFLIQHLRQEKIEIVHAHMMTGALVARLAATGTQARVVTTVHNSWQKHSVLMSVGHQVIAVSEAVRQEMVRRRVPARKLHTVLNGTLGSNRGEAAVPQTPVILEHPAVLCVAGLYVRKGIADLIEAASLLRERMPELKVYLAGAGPDRIVFEQQVLRLGLSSIIFLGFRSDGISLMQQANVFVLPSHSEPFGLVLSEARYAKCPVIATDVDGIPEALDGGRAGILVSPHDPMALAEAIEKVLCDPTLQEKLRKAGQENIQSLNVRRVCDETVCVYHDAMGNKYRSKKAK